VASLRISAGAAALLALLAAAVAPESAAGRVPYPGPRFGVPFELKLSGTAMRRWTIVEPTVFCEFSGSGSQTVTFHTRGWARARVFSVDRLHSPRANFYELEADLPLVVTVTRVDNTTQNPTDQVNQPCGGGSNPPHNCGGPRTVTATGVPVRARNRRLELDLMQNGTNGPLADAVNRLYPDNANCRFPSPEDTIAARVPWPGNRSFLQPGSHNAFTVRQKQTRLGSVISSDTQQSWATSEQFRGSFTLRTRNRCAAVPRSVRRRTGYVCNARNGTVLAR
jgi:hypothetical protein